MSNEKFNWKGLFINDEDSQAPKETTQKPQEKPSQSSSENSNMKFPDQKQTVKVADDAVLNTVIEMYEAGFDSLNQPGYDFYEFFKAIKAVGSNDPQIYKMALTMANSSDSSVSKSSLLTQADFYVEEIRKVHQQYEVQGNNKRNQIEKNLITKKENLKAEILGLEKKVLEIQNQINTKKNQIQDLDSNSFSELSEINQKISANDLAKTKILDTINTVVTGIKNNL